MTVLRGDVPHFFFTDLLPENLKHIVFGSKGMMARCLSKSIKTQIEHIPGFVLNLSNKGARDITHAFLAQFTRVCIVDDHGWNSAKGSSAALLRAMSSGLRVERLSAAVDDKSIGDLLAALLSLPPAALPESLLLQYKV